MRDAAGAIDERRAEIGEALGSFLADRGELLLSFLVDGFALYGLSKRVE